MRSKKYQRINKEVGGRPQGSPSVISGNLNEKEAVTEARNGPGNTNLVAVNTVKY